MMKIIDVKTMDRFQNPHGVEAKKIYGTDKADVVHITLKPGEALKKHTTPTDVFFYVLQGEGVVEIGEEKQKVSADMLIDSPAGIPHCWYNESPDALRFLVVKLSK
jgi:quercetin dioxygenase-like cupin family protein